MASIEQLRELAERLGKSTGPDLEVDRIIAVALDGYCNLCGLGDHDGVYQKITPNGIMVGVRGYTASIDAALELVERLLPGRDMALYLANCGGHRWCCQIERCPEHDPQYEGNALTHAIAILRALVAALIAQAEAA